VARSFKAEVMQAEASGLYARPGSGNVTLGASAGTWRESRACGVATTVQVENDPLVHVLPTLAKPVAAQRPSEGRQSVEGRPWCSRRDRLRSAPARPLGCPQ